jgi:membrane-bound lytic murein transglycosylase MltF
MKQESRFSRAAESDKGAEGLMQLMPVTGEELARKLELDDISHPEHNIQAGIFYLRKLYDLFEGSGDADRLKLTLAAYNAGLSRVIDAQELASYLHAKPAEWEAVKDALPLLSKRFYTLHRSVWGQDKPKSGWFGNAGQTLKYVDSVMDYYDDFRLALN